MSKYPSHRAFSLVELSIVLVILGLLVGGILAGKSLIRASELRSITVQKDQWLTAFRSFREKYLMLPGDMTNAEQFWGTLDPVDATCYFTASVDAKTCNGNGDGRIASASRSQEYNRAWQHMANAGIIPGFYKGYNGFATYAAYQDVLPPTKIGKVYWYPTYFPDRASGPVTGRYVGGSYGNSFFLGLPKIPFASGLQGVSGEELWNIDMKLDDGVPTTGNVVILDAERAGGLSNCANATTNDDPAGTYIMNSDLCVLAFRNLGL